MARRREINREEADVLANLGHVIHYYYDPSEPVGRHSRPNHALRSIEAKPTPIRHLSRAATRIDLTSQGISKNIRSTSKQAARVYDLARKILTAQAGQPLNRSKLCELIAAELRVTEKAVQVQVTRLIKFGYLKATKYGDA